MTRFKQSGISIGTRAQQRRPNLIVLPKFLAALPVCCCLILSACGNSAGPSSAGLGTSNESTTTPTTMPIVTTTQASPAPTPELVVCTEGQYFAIPSGTSGTVSPLVSVNQRNSAVSDNCSSLSSDLTKVAATESVSDGSTDAGYVTIQTDAFTDLSGHVTNYSGNTVTDGDPTFAPNTGDLWWTTGSNGEDGALYYAPMPNGPPSLAYTMPGEIGGFTPSGQASPIPVYTSPSGTSLAVAGGCGGFDCSQNFVIGSANTLTGECLQNADNSFGNFGAPQSCPGASSSDPTDCSASGDCNPFPCSNLLGLISNTSVACETSNSAFETIPFSISGASVTCGSPIQLTPPTQQTVSDATLSPDGQTIWYFAAQPSGSGAAVYEVPTSTPTPNPQGFMPTLSTSSGSVAATSLTGNNVEVGWYWKGKFISLQ
jgi:hypothetical protein